MFFSSIHSIVLINLFVCLFTKQMYYICVQPHIWQKQREFQEMFLSHRLVLKSDGIYPKSARKQMLMASLNLPKALSGNSRYISKH